MTNRLSWQIKNGFCIRTPPMAGPDQTHSGSCTLFQNADLLIAADCTAYAYANFHQDFIHGRVTLVGCPKLDAIHYSEKLTEILTQNDVKSVTIVRMEVPCCGGLEHAAKIAIQNSQKQLPWQVVTISIDGRIING